jgi:hypothetical protein
MGVIVKNGRIKTLKILFNLMINGEKGNFSDNLQFSA